MRAESRYRQIARALRREIKEGQLRPGGRLESEKQLEERFGASRNTVRLALGMLRNQGLVISRPGRGHFVQDVEIGRASCRERGTRAGKKGRWKERGRRERE